MVSDGVAGWSTVRTGIVIVLATAFVAQTAVAHHSFAPRFDAHKPMRITGTVTRFQSRNPHAYLHVEAVDESGQRHEYVCTSHGATQLARVGIIPEVLAPGTMVTLTGPQARDDPYMCFFKTVELADGRVLNVDGASGGAERGAVSRR
jgi:hypothetical protein